MLRQAPVASRAGPAVETLVTGRELGQHPEWNPCELVRGKVVRMSPSYSRHGKISALLVGLLFEYVRARNAGCLFTAEAGFYLERDPDTVRAPDVMFVARERIPKEGLAEGFLPFPPDLAIEVISPSDKFSEVMEKAHSYVAAGVRLVWVVDPQTERAYVFRPGQVVASLNRDESLAGEPVLPGLSLSLKELFAH